MSTEDNKALIRRYVEETVNKGNLAVVDELIDPTYVDHTAPPERVPGPQGEKEGIMLLRAEIPDVHFTIEDEIAEGDMVVHRWMARGTHARALTTRVGRIPATGMHVSTTGMTIYRIANGKIVESWGNFDELGLLQQLGVIPAPAQAASTSLHGVIQRYKAAPGPVDEIAR